ncbi:MAG: hypothetical protein J1E95_07055 [Muribaculaceae bacterium]|nr:hypothetical protein [Muribaculaceae bacterium]
MKTLYKITDKVWGISDLPWPVFYGLQGFVFLKIIIETILLCLVTVTYPLLYIFGVVYLVRKKKKPNWVRFALYTALMGWYVFCIVRYLILGYPIQNYSGAPFGNKNATEAVRPQADNLEDLIWEGDKLVPIDNSLEVSEIETLDTPAHYRFTVRDPEFEYEWLNTHRVEQNLEPVRLTRRQIRSLAGFYAWDSRIKFNTQAQLLNYLCLHVDSMQQYKISTSDPFGGKIKYSGSGNIADEYNDRFDDYQSDPEDELEFPPEIFDFQED